MQSATIHTTFAEVSPVHVPSAVVCACTCYGRFLAKIAPAEGARLSGSLLIMVGGVA